MTIDGRFFLMSMAYFMLALMALSSQKPLGVFVGMLLSMVFFGLSVYGERIVYRNRIVQIIKEVRVEVPMMKRRSPRQLAGYVYLVRTLHDDDLFKIGRAKDPDDRVHTFEVKFPFAIEYECLIKTENMFQLESILHRRFADKRQGGEFFRLTPADITYIKSLASMLQ